MKNYDIILVGKGLTGAAAAKYLLNDEVKIAIIGPDEPSHYEKAAVFSSHYDSGRIQRLIGKDDVWTRLNVASTKQYEEIQRLSGINFHRGVGCLYVNPEGNDAYLENAKNLSDTYDIPYSAYSSNTELSLAFPNFKFPDSSQGLFETNPSGMINPRDLIKAQLNIFEQGGGTIIKDTITDIQFKNNSFTLTSLHQKTYTATKVLLAPGSFINFFNLLPQKLDLKIKSEVVLMVKLSAAQAKKFSTLPSLLYEIDNGETEGVYLVPSSLYPDGKYYLKMGCNLPEDIYFENIEQVQDWFRKGESDKFKNRLTQTLKTIMPSLSIKETQTKRCIINRSVHERPYIGETQQEGLFVISGCNGYSAMCSDAIGRVAASIVNSDTLLDDFDDTDFELAYDKSNL